MAGTEEDNEVRRESVAPPAVAVVDSNTAHEAAAANENEQNLGLRKSFKLYRKAVLWSVFLSTCIVMEGFDLTLINNLYAYGPFKEKFGELQPDGSYELTAAWQSGLSNGALCGQIMGLFANGIIADRFGYRKTLCGALAACACFIFIIFFSESLTQLLIGEILIGFPWGVFQTLTTTYAAEVCPTHLRAYLTTYVNLCWVIGQFLASGVLVGMQARDDKWGYKIPFALQWMWPIPLTIGIWLAPESPWWLVRAGRLDEAKHVLGRLTERNTELAFDADATVSMMVQTNEMEKEVQAGYGYADLFRGVNRRRTEIVCMAWVAQTLCGSQMFAYSTYFYQQAGLAESQSFNMSLGMYAIGAVGTLSSWFLMGSFGRRTLYLVGQWSMAALLFTIGCIAFAPESDTAANWAKGSVLLVFAFVYNSTVGPICYSIVSEISSTRLRTKSVIMARNAYNVASIVTNIITPRMLNPTAWAWGARAGYFYAGTGALVATWSYFRLPEPKGRTYAELDVLFERGVSARKFASTVVDRLDAHVAGGDAAAGAGSGDEKNQALQVEKVKSEESS